MAESTVGNEAVPPYGTIVVAPVPQVDEEEVEEHEVKSQSSSSSTCTSEKSQSSSSSTDNKIAAQEMPDNEIAAQEIPDNKIAAQEIPDNEMAAQEIPNSDFAAHEIPDNEMACQEIPYLEKVRYHILKFYPSVLSPLDWLNITNRATYYWERREKRYGAMDRKTHRKPDPEHHTNHWHFNVLELFTHTYHILRNIYYLMHSMMETYTKDQLSPMITLKESVYVCW